jgi:hypothetical protein
METPDTLAPVIQSVPEPQVVREQLGKSLRQTKILRRLLRVSEDAAREREREKARSSSPGAVERQLVGSGH